MNLQNIQSLGAATFAWCSAPWNYLKDLLRMPPAVQKPHQRVTAYLYRLHQQELDSWRNMELWYFYEKFHMSAKTFDQLAEKLAHSDLSQPPADIIREVKLASVLEYLACGSARWVCSFYGIADGEVFGRIVDVVCEAINTVMEAELPKWSTTNLLQISADIQKQCKFPNCVGLMGEKLIGTKEKGSGEGPDTIMMLAICKADFSFSYVHVVAYDSAAKHCGVDVLKDDFFGDTRLGMSIANGGLRAAPADSLLRGIRMPYVLLADEWFSLRRHVMTPYDHTPLTLEENVYNQRFRSALSCIDKAFKLLDTKWACLRYKRYTNCDRQMAVAMACSYLHNFLVDEKKPAVAIMSPSSKKARYEASRSSGESDPSGGAMDAAEFDADRVRDNFKEYFARLERCRSRS